MRKQLLTTVAAMAIATPALAADLSGGVEYNFIQDNAPSYTAVGDIEFSLGGIWTDVEDQDEKNFLEFQGWARANVPLGGMWNILPEVGGNAYFGGDLPDGFSTSTLGTNLHLWAGNGVRVGAFGGATFSVFNSLTFGQAGAEIEADMGNLTLGAQGFYTWWIDPCGGCGNPELYGVNAWIDLYLNSNTKLTGLFGWAQGNDLFGGPGETIDIYNAGGRLTHRFAGSPVNAFVEGSYLYGSNGGDGHMVNVLGGITIVLDGNRTQEEFDKMVPFTFRNPMVDLTGFSFSAL